MAATPRGVRVSGSLGPAAIAIRDRLRQEIAAGELSPGQRLGAEREIAERLGVSRSTVRSALADLERSGAVRRVRGRAGGIFVAERKVERDLTSLAGLAGLPAPAGLSVRRPGHIDGDRRGRRRDRRSRSGWARARSCSRSSAYGWPTASRSRWSARRFRPSQFPDLLDRSLSGSLYELLQTHYGLEPGEAEERIEVVAAGAAEARLLGVPRGVPLVAIARTAWSADGVAFERSHDLFRGDRVRIVVRARSAPKTSSVVAASVEVL